MGEIVVVVHAQEDGCDIVEELEGVRLVVGRAHLLVKDVAVLHVARHQQLVDAVGDQDPLVLVLEQLVQLPKGSQARRLVRAKHLKQ